MSSIFNTPAYAIAAPSALSRSSETERLAPVEAANPGGESTGAASRAAGGPAATGAVAEPTAQAPAPAATPPVSVSQLGVVAAAAVNGQGAPVENATGTPQDPQTDPAAQAAQAYRDATETTNGAEPGKLMIAA